MGVTRTLLRLGHLVAGESEKRDAARIRALERKALRKPLSLWEQAELAQLKQAASKAGTTERKP